MGWWRGGAGYRCGCCGTTIRSGCCGRRGGAKAAADRWMGLITAFTGGDPGITKNLQRVWENEDEIVGIDTGEMRELGEYIAAANAASTGE